MKVVIIGSGIAGMTAGAYLSRYGCAVTVLEQNDDIGGVTGGFTRDGYSWDMGQLVLEGFGPGEQAGIVLEELGVLEQIVTERSDRTYVFPDMTIRPPEKYAGTWWRKDFLAERFPAERKGLDRYYRMYVRFMKLITIARKAERAKGLSAFALKVKLYATLLPLVPRIRWSAQKMSDYLFTDNRLKAIFISILADFVVRPSQFPGLGIPAVNPEPAFDRRVPLDIAPGTKQPSYRLVQGGCRTIIDALAGAIKARGGRIITGVVATRIMIENNMVKGVLCGDGSRYDADLVLASGGAKEAFLDLVGKELLPKKFAAHIESIPLMQSILMVHLGIDFDPRPFQKDAVCYYYRTYDVEEAVDNLQKGVYHEGNDGFLIYIPSIFSNTSAPAGKYAVTVYTVAPNTLNKGSWSDRKEELADTLLRFAEEIIPGLRAGARTKTVFTPEDFRARTHLKHHAFGGCAPVMGTKGAPHRTPVRGLWFIGAQSESGAGMNNVVEGAWRAARMIMKENSIPG
ncbi:MAG: NAD(P)/FAD-dependent oxidoreductase [Spirochaetes bacterium]|nr:MAG: NAD(P)/FAD-dependent oxidoreductase [Spirochaetota bacterium]